MSPLCIGVVARMMARILLAPMEGLADATLRRVLTAVGGYDWCVSEFMRVSNSVLPYRHYYRFCPELQNGARTAAGTPMRVQLMGSDPEMLAANAAHLAKISPFGIDLNFGCPAPLVNRHGGGASLLAQPEQLYRIAHAVAGAVPLGIPFTAKMRLGVNDTLLAVDCAQALAAGGVSELVVHGRTRADGYRPPARWAEIGRVREALKIPVIANGEIWTLADYRACVAESGCVDVMLGRGAVADPLLARRLRGEEFDPDEAWRTILAPAIADYWQTACTKVLPKHAPGRLKQWLMLVRRAWPQGEALYGALRPHNHAVTAEVVLAAAGILPVAADAVKD